MGKYLSENQEIGELIRKMESEFISGGGTLMSKYVTTDLYSDISKIYAYLDSKHITGSTDSMGRQKPFFNIVLAARNIYYRATDLDTKHFEFRANTSAQVIPAIFATAYLQEWMRKENYGSFLNQWGMELAGFNSAVVKHVESQGKLHAMVVPWSRIICDQINFDQNPKIELLELTEAELYGRVKTHGYSKEMVEKLCDALQARELTDGTQQDTKSNHIKLYELHGNLELSCLTGNEKDDDVYAQQMHVVSFVASKEEGRYDDFTLASGREEKDPYTLTSLLPSSDGSISLNGSVKNLFEAQWMMNHTVKSIKDQLDLASKLVFQTADASFVGRNVLTAIQNGDIMVHKENMPLTQMNNNSHDIGSQESFGNMWKSLSSEINGVSESMLGNTAPSGTAWRQVEALLAESHSLFDLMTENKGLDASAMVRKYVLPHIKKKAKNREEILATLEAHNISKIDQRYIPAEAIRRFNARNIEAVLSGRDGDVQQFDATTQAIEEQAVQKDLTSLGNQRPLAPDELDDETWTSIMDGLDDLEINPTGESKDINAVLTTLNTTLQLMMNPAYASNQQAQFVVGKILQTTGNISPLEIPPPPAPVLPAQVGGQ